jgi:hypothetical protein
MKVGRAAPEFASDVLPADQHAWVAQRLASCATVDAVRAVFAEARSREGTPEQESAVVATSTPPSGILVDMATFQQQLQREMLDGFREMRSQVLQALAALG